MRTTVDLAKSVYLWGEEIEVKIVVTNPTNNSLIVLQPFHPDNGQVRMVNLRDEDAIRQGYPISRVYRSDFDAYPIETLAAGESRVLSFRSSDRLDINQMVGPEEPGRYGVAYGYQGTTASFRVVRPEMEAITEARFPNDYLYVNDDADEPPTATPVFRYIFALRYNGVTSICGARRAMASYREHGQPRYLGPLQESVVRNIEWYKVVATRPESVVNIQATMDNAENLTILYTTAGGGQPTRLDLDKNLNPR